MPCPEDMEKEFYRLNPPPPKDDLITISRKDLLALEAAREEIFDLERRDKELREQVALLNQESEEQQDPPARKGRRQPRKKKGSKKPGGERP